MAMCPALSVFNTTSAFGGYLITKKAFQPVKQITAAAERIGSGSDLSQRINLNKADPEIMQLAQTFDSMFSRLEKSFDAERQFTADASHELRTPAAAIIAQAEYALKQAPPAEKDEALQKYWRRHAKCRAFWHSF